MPAANDDDETTGQAAKAEQDIRREGRYLRAGGAFMAGAVVFTALATPSLPHVVVVAALICAALAFSAGVLERATRPIRAALSIATANQQTGLRAQERILAQLEHIEATFADLAAALPDEIDKRWWTGFGAAATEGLLDTGTVGRSNPPGHVTGDVLKFRRNRPPTD